MLPSYMRFNFSFGKKKASITTIVVLSLIVASLSSCLKIEEKHIWDIVYEYLQTYQPDSPLIPELQKDSGIVERDVERTVDKAIRDYERLTGDDNRVRIPAPQYSETTVDTDVCYTDECRALGGEMRLCSPWVDNCSSSVVE
jgi:siderophore synthetase component